MRILVVIFGFGGFIGLIINSGRKLYQWLKPLFKRPGPWMFGGVYGVIFIAVLGAFVASRMPDNGVPWIIFSIIHYILGFLIYLMMIVNLAAVVLFLGRLVHLLPSPLPNSASILVGSLVLLVSLGVSVYGVFHAKTIQTQNYEVEVSKADAEADKMKIALISDLHFGYVMEENLLEQIISKVNALKPDLICIVGDIFDGDATALKNPDRMKDLLGRFTSTYGAYACLGNHDAGVGYEQMVEYLTDAGIQVLQDESVVIDQKVVLAGRKDSSPVGDQGEERKPLEKTGDEEKLPVIVMDHQPGNIDSYGENVDLILCGHTHQGQIFPLNLITNLVNNVNYGYFRASEQAPQVIVTSGVGTWGPPQRVATDSEVVSIQLKISPGQQP